MREFDYLHPQTLAEGLELLARYQNRAKVLSGGTDLLIELRKEKGPAGPELIVNIAHLTELRYIREDGDWIRIGANTTHTELAASRLVQRECRALADAARTVGSPQIRNRGTIGGNIINASPAADPVPVLTALDAVLSLRSAHSQREIPIADLYTGPYQTTLRADELLTEVAFRKLPATAKSAFIKLGRRNALAIARMNVAVILDPDETGVIRDLRIVPGSTMPVPGRCRGAEEVLRGRQPTEELVAAAGAEVSAEMLAKTGYRWSTAYKKPVIEALTRRAIYQALEGQR